MNPGLGRNTCPWCEGPLVDTGWRLPDRMFSLPGRFRFDRCRECRSLTLVDPPDDLSIHYPEGAYYSYQGAHLPTEDPLFRLPRPAAWRLRQAMTLPEPGRILDIGCGVGNVLDLYQKRGWETWGVEISREIGEKASNRGHRILIGGFPDVLTESSVPSGGFRVVRMRHVLEHLSTPREVLTAVTDLLEPGTGLLLAETPNVGGWLARLAGSRYWQLDAPRHLTLPTSRALQAVLPAAGLEILGIRTYSHLKALGRTLEVAWFERRGKLPPGKRRVVALGRWWGRLVDLLNRGDNLQVVARRPATTPSTNEGVL